MVLVLWTPMTTLRISLASLAHLVVRERGRARSTEVQ